MCSFLQSQDLWGIVDGTLIRLVPANVAASTPEENAPMHQWDTMVTCALGNITLCLAPSVF